eukprot:scaffold217087_cov31-Tisochrysis_lutea.AAC.1
MPEYLTCGYEFCACLISREPAMRKKDKEMWRRLRVGKHSTRCNLVSRPDKRVARSVYWYVYSNECSMYWMYARSMSFSFISWETEHSLDSTSITSGPSIPIGAM